PSAAPHGHLQQPALGGGEGFCARPLSRRASQDDEPFSAERSDTVAALRGGREGGGWSRRACRAARGTCGRPQERPGRGARGPASAPERALSARSVRSDMTRTWRARSPVSRALSVSWLWMLVVTAPAPPAGADTVITVCTENNLANALAAGGIVTFNCGPNPT